jgi:CHAD domain-containing protein
MSGSIEHVHSDGLAGDQPCGLLAHGLLVCKHQRLLDLWPQVLADRDPEPLHQMRVACRQLSCTLEQFSPFLDLGDVADPLCFSRIRRAIGATRDLDVLSHQLAIECLPGLPGDESALLALVVKRTARHRRKAFASAARQLSRPGCRKRLRRWQKWLRHPGYTRYADDLVSAWLPELQHQVLADLFWLPGWHASSLEAPRSIAQLHQLRRRIKRARYGLLNLEPMKPIAFSPWIGQLKTLQTVLGGLHDLHALEHALSQCYGKQLHAALPTLVKKLADSKLQKWEQWQQHCRQWRSLHQRRALRELLLLQP